VNQSYQVQQFAELAGVTVRALHHYDRMALLKPRRTQAGYRLYGIGDLERLEQIVALKFLGLPLKQIKTLLDREARQLTDALRSQRRALEEKRRRLDRAIEAIRNAEKAIRPGQQADAAVLKKIIEVIEMQDNTDFMKKYYSEEAQAKMTVRREQWNPKLQEQATKDWDDLFRDVEAALGDDPASPKVQALAARWKKLVEGFTGGDREVSTGLKKAWGDRDNWPPTMQQQSAPFADKRIWEFMGKAMKCGG
jgi:MerR family transcriptional regulator, thiopeptide resistance regulator